MIRVGLLGHVADGQNIFDGQTVKTREMIKALEKYSDISLDICDTYYLKSKKYKILVELFNLFKSNDVIIISLSWNGYHKILPLLYGLSLIFNRRIFDFVIGGSRQNYLANHKMMRKYQDMFETIYVESPRMVEAYKDLGINSVEYMPNFKNNKILESKNENFNSILKVCTLSRICKEKGIEDAIEAVEIVNSKATKIKCELTIFGEPDHDYIEEFSKIQKKLPEYIKCGGLINYWDTVDILKDYDILLFPTYHEGEGFPGTIIDAFSAGVPIIATDWNFNTELIDKDKGSIVPIKNPSAIAMSINYYIKNRDELYNKGKNCLEAARKYRAAEVLQSFAKKILSKKNR